jgi:hypothetical protein
MNQTAVLRESEGKISVVFLKKNILFHAGTKWHRNLSWFTSSKYVTYALELGHISLKFMWTFL